MHARLLAAAVLVLLIGCGGAPPQATPPPPATQSISLSPPSPQPPSFDGCQRKPNPAAAPNDPIKIVIVLKMTNPEVVRLQNVSTNMVDLADWNMCSVNGNEAHDDIDGVLAPGETRDFPYERSGAIWHDTQRDDGVLYDPDGRLVSYWQDT
jgi:micrococcal nuclease